MEISANYIRQAFSFFLPSKRTSIVCDFKPKAFRSQFLTSDKNQKIVVEIGVGKGLFIKSYAEKHPDKKFIGIEKVRKWIRHSATRIEKKDLKNICLFQTSGEEALEAIPPESVNEYYILFPDPWPKRRHAKRRLIQQSTLEKIIQTLKKEGILYVVTDHAEYHDWIIEKIAPFLSKFDSMDKTPEFISNYQIKYQKEGRKIYFMHLKKC